MGAVPPAWVTLGLDESLDLGPGFARWVVDGQNLFPVLGMGWNEFVERVFEDAFLLVAASPANRGQNVWDGFFHNFSMGIAFDFTVETFQVRSQNSLVV